MAKPEYDLCVIGGGSAGLVVAAGGAKLGAKVVLIEKRALGGDCLYHGCIPSKTLIHSAKVAQVMRSAGRYGLESRSPSIELGRIMDRVASVISAIEPHDSPERFRSLGVEVLFGAGEFTDPHTFQVNGRTISARNFVLATGSRAAVPPLAGLDRAPFLTNETLFSLRVPVPSLIVLGAGPLGIEMAQAFCRLSSEVQVVEQGPQILPREDEDLAQVVANQLVEEGVRLHLGTQALCLEGGEGDLRLRVRGPDGKDRIVAGSHLLVATGRRANWEGLGLEAAGVVVEKGRIRTNRCLRTSNKNIFACGDVTSPYQFTHVAENQAGIVLRNALFHLRARMQERVIPWCTFTDPELARVGLSEREARSKGIPYRPYLFPFSEIDRAQTEGESAGFSKILTDPSGRLLGAAIVGPHAGELIHEYVLALESKMRASHLSRPIHIYPTLAQINRKVAEGPLKAALTPTLKRWIRILFRLRGS